MTRQKTRAKSHESMRVAKPANKVIISLAGIKWTIGLDSYQIPQPQSEAAGG